MLVIINKVDDMLRRGRTAAFHPERMTEKATVLSLMSRVLQVLTKTWEKSC